MSLAPVSAAEGVSVIAGATQCSPEIMPPPAEVNQIDAFLVSPHVNILRHIALKLATKGQKMGILNEGNMNKDASVCCSHLRAACRSLAGQEGRKKMTVINMVLIF